MEIVPLGAHDDSAQNKRHKYHWQGRRFRAWEMERTSRRSIAPHSHLPVTLDRGEEVKRRALVAQATIQKGQVSRARHVAHGVSSGSKEQRNIRFVAREKIPQRVLEYSPERPVVLSRKIFTKCLQEVPSGSSPGPRDCTNEMLRVCLDGGELFQLLYLAAQDFADGSAPAEVRQALTRATMTALRKIDGGVRGIATGIFPPIGGEIMGTTVRPGGGASVFSISVRLVHTGRSGLCGACSADCHLFRS